MTENGIMTRLT